jgi:hypothetical protein
LHLAWPIAKGWTCPWLSVGDRSAYLALLTLREVSSSLRVSEKTALRRRRARPIPDVVAPTRLRVALLGDSIVR